MENFVYSKTILNSMIDIGNKEECLISSDYHIGNKEECFRYIYMMFNFARRAGINDNIICGDLFDGLLQNAKYKSYDSQIKHFLNSFPEYVGLKNYYIYGNHDNDFAKHDISIKQEISCRKDFINIGGENTYIKFNDVAFVIKHVAHSRLKINDKPITFRGHSHTYQNLEKYRTIYVPALCNISTNNINGRPGFLVLKVIGDRAYITNYETNNEIEQKDTVCYQVKKLGTIYQNNR